MDNHATATADMPEYIHVSRDTALWVHNELTDIWECLPNDDIHMTYHLTRALLEIKDGLGLAVD